MARQGDRGYQNHKYYNSNGSYRIVYTVGSAAPRYDEQPDAYESPAEPVHAPQRRQPAPAQQPQRRSAQTAPAGKQTRRKAQAAPKRPPQHQRTQAQPVKKQKRRQAQTQSVQRQSVQKQKRRRAAAVKQRQAKQDQARKSSAQAQSKRSRAQASPAGRPMYDYGQTVPAGRPLYDYGQTRPRTRAEQLEQEHRKQSAEANCRRESVMNRNLVTFLIAMASVVCGFCGVYVHMTAEVQETQTRITSLTDQVQDLRQKNDALENSLYTGVDLETVRTEAETLGMVSLENAKIRYFTMDNSDYSAGTITLTD